MDQEGSTPDNQIQGGQQDQSPTTGSAENVAEQAPSQSEDTIDFFGNEEEGDNTDSSASDNPSNTTETDDDTTDQSDVDPELTKWATSQNLQLNTPTEIALAKRLRDTQKAYHEKAAESKGKFTEAVNESNDGNQSGIDNAKLARMEFFFENPDAKDLEQSMIDIALEARESGNDTGFKYYQTPQGWKDLFSLAKARANESQGKETYESGRKDERTNLAKKQQAAKVAANANNSAPTGDGKLTDEQVGNMSLAEYQAYTKAHPEFNPFA